MLGFLWCHHFFRGKKIFEHVRRHFVRHFDFWCNGIGGLICWNGDSNMRNLFAFNTLTLPTFSRKQGLNLIFLTSSRLVLSYFLRSMILFLIPYNFSLLLLGLDFSFILFLSQFFVSYFIFIFLLCVSIFHLFKFLSDFNYI